MTETPEVTPKITQELIRETTPEQRTEPNDPRKTIEKSNLPQETKDAALTIIDAVQTKTEQQKKPINKKAIINLIVMIGFLGGTTACSESWQRRAEEQLDPAKYSDDPNVQRAYSTYLQEKEKQDLGTDLESPVQAPELDLTNQSYEIFGATQEYAAGTKVMVDAGGYGINVRNSPEINSREATIYPDGTIFIINESAGSKDGYNWVSVATEDGEIIGFAATNWLKVLQP
ncbi:MAG: hypothetical protein GX559_00025 [Candidatus Pacebacteria bacterium]|nr:hypothetical protein [Candidatus Paceibacterota bacterium]